MDGAVVALVIGIIVVVWISKIRPEWLKAAGGLLILATVLIVVIDGLKLLGR